MADADLTTVHVLRKRSERRSNVDRSATTRRQILEATIRCLGKMGYGAVTNIRVADEAGVSRGAMLHHFPTRQHLLVAAIEHAYKNMMDYRMKVLSKLLPGLPRYRALIDLAWVTARIPEGVAWNEVRNGCRSDPEIRAAITPVMSRLSDDHARLIGRLVREAGLTPNSEVHGLTTITAMTVQALAINALVYPRAQVVQNALAGLKAMREGIIAKQLGAKAALSAADLEREALPRIRMKRSASA